MPSKEPLTAEQIIQQARTWVTPDPHPLEPVRLMHFFNHLREPHAQAGHGFVKGTALNGAYLTGHINSTHLLKLASLISGFRVKPGEQVRLQLFVKRPSLLEALGNLLSRQQHVLLNVDASPSSWAGLKHVKDQWFSTERK